MDYFHDQTVNVYAIFPKLICCIIDSIKAYLESLT